MKRFNHLFVAIMVLFVTIAFMTDTAVADKHFGPRAKNIIFMVPDGMGLADVTATRIFKNGPDGEPLSFETLTHIGYQRTHAKNSTVTDSAAAASTWACGEKFNNGEISCHDDNFDGVCDSVSVPTILEIAKKYGKSTGLVATSDITHATPAVFGAHVHNRKCEEEIARQLIEVTQVDVLLGGGIAANRSSCKLAHSEGDWLESLLAMATSNSYAVVDNKVDMKTAVEGGAKKLLGLFQKGGKSPENFWVDPTMTYPDNEPTLEEMALATLDILEKNKRGFFCMIEGSQIDWANHGNRFYPDDPYQNSQLGEMLAFDATVEAVMDWINAEPWRKFTTLLVVVADHETGGFAIDGPYGTLSEPETAIQDGWTSGSHSAVDTLIWSQGPGAWYLNAALDNTDLYYVMKKVMR